MNYGYLITGPIVADILNANNIPNIAVGLSPGGENVTYMGKPYSILEREVWFPPDSTSPDGWHIVYAPSPEEIAQNDPNRGQPNLNDMLAKLMNVAILGILAYAVVNVAGVFKKR